MKNSKFLLSLLVFASLSFNACKKDQVDFTELSATSEDIAITSDLSQDAEDESFNQIENRGGDPAGSCPTVTWENPKGVYPNKVTIDFGTSCTSVNGRVRSGMIVVTMTDTITKAGAVRTATLVNYKVDGIAIEGSKTLTNLGIDGDGYPYFSRVTNNCKITFLDGNFTTWQANQTIRFKAGFGTKTPLDDIVIISGSGSGINRKGNAFGYNISTPLVKNKSCKWITQGVIETTAGAKTISIDFGNGDCDRLAKLTLPSGIVKDILLRP